MLRPLSALGAALLLTLTTLSVGTSASADRPDQLPAQASDRAAQQALERAEKLFAGGRDRGRDNGNAPAAAHGREATLVLRDLAVARERLTGQDRQRADAILARPTDGTDDPFGDGYTRESVRECSTDVCVHWVQSSGDRIDLTDGDRDGVPDYAERVLSTMQGVHDTYTAAGYREPLPDGEKGGDNKTDVYLADVGPQGFYGYCASDQQQWRDGNAVHAYCVLDNDYADDEFPNGNTPVEDMQVTAAHEYFHAVQFAYDYLEDPWFMEATATWAEDEVFDDIDDNVQYLRYGPLRRPHIAMDQYAGLHHYGTWIFFRHLTERLTERQPAVGGMPTLVRDMWEAADSTRGEAADQYSIQAVRNVLRERGQSWPRTFSEFAAENRQPRQTYAEAAANRYPAAPLAARSTLTPRRRATSWQRPELDHLASATYRFTPGTTMRHGGWKLRLRLDMAPRRRGSAAVVTTLRTGQQPERRLVSLDRSGAGSQVVRSFSRGRVSAVEVTLVNHSTRMRCWRDGSWRYSCSGTPRDDNQVQRIRGIAYR